jgi:hypothetical protein
MKQSLIVAFAFIGVFLCGAIVGGIVTFRYGHKVVRETASEEVGQQNLKQLVEVLQLTPEQQKSIRPIIVRTAKELAAHRRDSAAIRERSEAELRPLLTESQRAAYDEFRQIRRDREKKWQDWIRLQRTKRSGEPPVSVEGTPPPPAKTE